jgi:hypothetical protein
MPNWCYNHVVFDGPSLVLRSIGEKAMANGHGQELSFLRAFIPMPEEYTTLEGYNSGGYEWCIDNWGTKWAESSIEMTASNFGDTGQIICTFDSAWSPPLTGYEKISGLFPELTLIHLWDEPGLQFCGIRVTKNGEEIMMEEIFDSNYPLMSFDDEDGENKYYEEMESLRDRLFASANDAIKSLT